MNKLQELREYVQKMRENGDTDLRSILYVIDQLIKNPNYQIIINEDEE